MGKRYRDYRRIAVLWAAVLITVSTLDSSGVAAAVPDVPMEGEYLRELLSEDRKKSTDSNAMSGEDEDEDEVLLILDEEVILEEEVQDMAADSEETDYRVHVIWKDDPDALQAKLRPDLYLTLWRSVWVQEEGKWALQSKEAVPEYSDWEAFPSGKDRNSDWHWVCSFDGLPGTDEEGNRYEYSAEARMYPEDSGYRTCYFKGGVLDGDDQLTDLKAALNDEEHCLNGGMTFEEAETTAEYYEFAPNQGVIVNIPGDTCCRAGQVVFDLGDLVLRTEDQPSVTLELRWRRKEESTEFREITELLGTEYPGRVTLNADENPEYRYVFGLTEGGGEHAPVCVLPRYDAEGYETEYAVSETEVNGKTIIPGAPGFDEYLWVSDSTECEIINVYRETEDYEYKAVIAWEKADAAAGCPEITVRLNRGMRKGTGDQEKLLLYTVQKDIAFQTIEVPSDLEETQIVFDSLSRMAPTGYEWFYWISQDKADGCSCVNRIDEMLEEAESRALDEIFATELNISESLDGQGRQQVFNRLVNVGNPGGSGPDEPDETEPTVSNPPQFQDTEEPTETNNQDNSVWKESDQSGQNAVVRSESIREERLPRTGDAAGGIPAKLLAATVCGMAVGAAALFCRKKEDGEDSDN